MRREHYFRISRRGGDLDRLPEEDRKNLKVPIEEGLRFVIEKDRM